MSINENILWHLCDAETLQRNLAIAIFFLVGINYSYKLFDKSLYVIVFPVDEKQKKNCNI